MTRKVLVVTGSRAEYGLLRPVMCAVRDCAELELQVAVTGMHLSPEFGLTQREIESDGFPIDARIDVGLESDSPVAIARSMGLGLIGFGEALERLRPDVMVVLGDRFEIFPAAAAALVARIPVAHIHGGESTAGAIDEAIRHSITKMSHLHFVAAEEYRRRVIQLGEDPERVFLVGGLGVDALKTLTLLSRAELEASLGFRFRQRNLLVTFHPVTLEHDTACAQMAELLAALDGIPDTGVIFTMPNADTGGRALMAQIDAYVSTHPLVGAYASLGQARYLSCLREVDGVVGNSSSGLTEAPSLRKGTVNIGERQTGRLKAASVIDCAPERASIAAAIDRLYSPEFQASLATIDSPYGAGGASGRIVAVLRDYPLGNLLKKRFHDVHA